MYCDDDLISYKQYTVKGFESWKNNCRTSMGYYLPVTSEGVFLQKSVHLCHIGVSGPSALFFILYLFGWEVRPGYIFFFFLSCSIVVLPYRYPRVCLCYGGGSVKFLACIRV